MSDQSTVAKPAQAAPAKVNVDPTKKPSATVAAPPPFQVMPITADIRYIKVMVYGVPGSGKTWLAGSAVDVDEMQDVLVLSAESGILTVMTSEKIVNRQYIDIIPVTQFKPVGYVQEFLKAHCAARDARNVEVLKALQARVFGYSKDIIDEDCEDDEYETEIDEFTGKEVRTYTRVRLRKYKTIIIDSVSEINAYLIYHLLGITPDTKFDAGEMEETAGWDEYKKGNQMLNMILRAYRDLPMHVIFICGTQYTQDHQKMMRWTPNLIGKLGQQVQGYVDIAGYLVAQKPNEGQVSEGTVPRSLFIQPVGSFEAKNRLSTFKDASIQDPTMQKLMDAFRGVKRSLKAVKPIPGKK